MKVLYNLNFAVKYFDQLSKRAGLMRYSLELFRALRRREDDLSIKGAVWDMDVTEFENQLSKLQKEHADIAPVDLATRKNFVGGLLLKTGEWVGNALGRSGSAKRFLNMIPRMAGYERVLFQDMDLVHSPCATQWPPGKLCEVPHVITIHDMLPFKYPEWFVHGAGEYFFSLMKQIDREKDVLICVSEATRKELLSAVTIPEKRCFVIPLAAADIFSHRNGGDKSMPQVLSKWNLNRDGYILSVAMFEPKKNVSMLVKCFSELIKHKEIGDLVLVLVGIPRWGDEGEAILELAAKSSGRILLTGYVSDEELCTLYNNCLMFVYVPSSEGFGLPPLEAMQCGAPVITSNCSSLPEVVGEAALKITPKNEQELCDAIKKVAGEARLREELRQRGIERAKIFSWENTAELTVEAYRFAINHN